MRIVGDCREVLRDLPKGSVQTCVTSPPYWGLRDYGVKRQIGLEKTPELFVQQMVEVFRLVREVLADDGTLWLNLGDSYSGGGGFSPDSPSNQGSGQYVTNSGKSRLYKGRAPASGLKPKDLCGMPWRVAFALQADGWYLRSDIIWHKPNPMPESVTDRPGKAHEYLFLLTKRPVYYYDAEAIKEPTVTAIRSREKNNGESAVDTKMRGSGSHCGTYEGGRNRRTVWTIATSPYPDAHFATFPKKLVEPCILAGSRPGDVVLDPFGGSGTTAEVAQSLGRKWILIELSAKYGRLIDDRMRKAA